MKQFDDLFMDVNPQHDVLNVQVKKLQDVLLQLFMVFEQKTGMIVSAVYVKRYDVTTMSAPTETIIEDVVAAVHINHDIAALALMAATQQQSKEEMKGGQPE